MPTLFRILSLLLLTNIFFSQITIQMSAVIAGDSVPEIPVTINLLADPSFEQSDSPKPGYILIGDYHSDTTCKDVSFYTDKAFDAKRSLCLQPQGYFTFFGADYAQNQAIFSLYTATPDEQANSEIEISLQLMRVDMHGVISNKSWNQRFAVNDVWTRQFVVTDVQDNSKRPVDFNYYRVVVRNTGASAALIDAVQLEQTLNQPTEFRAVQDSKFRSRVNHNISMKRYENMEIGENSKIGRIALTVKNPNNWPETAMLVRGGVPFPAGELFCTDDLVLRDQHGQEIASQYHVLGRRPIDSSVVSLLTQFQVDLPANSETVYYLHYGQDLADNNQIKADNNQTVVIDNNKFIAQQDGKDIVIDTGALTLTLTPFSESLFKDQKARCVVETSDNKIHSGAAEIAEIIENGTESCLIYLRGRSFLTWELRLTAWRNKPYIKIDYSFERNFTHNDPLLQRIKSIYLELPNPDSSQQIVTNLTNIVTSDDNRQSRQTITADIPAYFTQTHIRSGEGDFIANITSQDHTVQYKSACFTGLFGTDKLWLRLHEMAEMSPRAVAFTEDSVRIYHWPDREVNYLDVFAGFSSTLQLDYSPLGEAVPAGLDAVLYPDPKWIRDSKVFGLFLTASEMQEKFPRLNANLSDIEESIRQHTDVTFMYGLADYGDIGSRNYYKNHETAAVQHLWSQFLRTGRTDDFFLAAAHSRHQRDIDQCHFRRGTVGVHPHQPLTNLSYNFHTGHFWQTGQLYHYYLTGDHRTLESIIGSAAILVQKSAIQYKRGRERHRMLQHLAEIYELTGNIEIRKAFERQYDHNGESDPTSYYGGLSVECLLKLYDVTAEQKYLDRVLTEAEELYQRNTNLSAMPEDFNQIPGRTGYANEGRSWLSLYASGLVTLLTGDPKYLHYLEADTVDPVLARLVSPISRDYCAEWLGGYLVARSFCGLLEPEFTPEQLHFSNRLIGRMLRETNQPFVYQLSPDPDGKVTLDVYRQRRFRYWNYKSQGDFVAVKFTAADGTVLAEDLLQDNVTLQHKRYELTVPGQVTASLNYQIEYKQDDKIINDDAWGGVSTPNQVTMSLDRWFSARNCVSVPLKIPLTCPDSGKLTICWRTTSKVNAQISEPMTAKLTTLSGQPIAQSRFIVPLDNPQANDNEPFSHQYTLTIPAEYQGQQLLLWLPDTKWLEWRIMENLQ